MPLLLLPLWSSAIGVKRDIAPHTHTHPRVLDCAQCQCIESVCAGQHLKRNKSNKVLFVHFTHTKIHKHGVVAFGVSGGGDGGGGGRQATSAYHSRSAARGIASIIGMALERALEKAGSLFEVNFDANQTNK